MLQYRRKHYKDARYNNVVRIRGVEMKWKNIQFLVILGLVVVAMFIYINYDDIFTKTVTETVYVCDDGYEASSAEECDISGVRIPDDCPDDKPLWNAEQGCHSVND